MLRVIFFACLVSVISAECLLASTPDLKLKSGDIAVGPNSFFVSMNFTQAQEQCDRIGGQLVNVENKRKLKAVSQCFKDKSLSVDYVWTGAECVKGKWQWSNGQKIFAYCEDGKPSGPCSVEEGVTIDDDAKCLYGDNVEKSGGYRFACEVKSG